MDTEEFLKFSSEIKLNKNGSISPEALLKLQETYKDKTLTYLRWYLGYLSLHNVYDRLAKLKSPQFQLIHNLPIEDAASKRSIESFCETLLTIIEATNRELEGMAVACLSDCPKAIEEGLFSPVDK